VDIVILAFGVFALVQLWTIKSAREDSRSLG
jgi:hypothetical protein